MPIGIAIAGAFVAFGLVGAIGSLLDNPRPAFLFFFLLFWALELTPGPTVQEQPWAGPMRRRGQRRISTHFQYDGSAVMPVGTVVRRA
jgi:hypothetical protein